MGKHSFHAVLVDAEGKHMYGACFDRVQKYSLESGALEAEYILPDAASQSKEPAATSPPRKKAKTEENGEEKKTDEEKKTGGNQQDGVKAIRTLHFTRSGKYVIATESKSVLLLDAGDLSLYSQRTFPKRPSAVVTSIDDEDLLVGDKFGDVYSVPLLSKDALVLSSSEAAKESKESKNIEPILGHVSMLVDMTLVENNGKQYVITADRDEHIRVSRYPQSFIVERWLFGHKEFVSSLCVIPWATEILVSGGGDDFLAVWNWTTGELLQKFDIRSVISKHLTEEFHTALRKGGDLEISVTAIVPLPKTKQLAVLCEATNVVIVLDMDDQTKKLETHSSREHNDCLITDIAASADGNILLKSLDGDHLIAGDKIDEAGELTPWDTPALPKIDSNGSVELREGDVGYPLYSIKHLRKRGEF